MFQSSFNVETSGRVCIDLTARVKACVQDAGVESGLCHVFLKHTSASLMLCENADPDVLRDMETFMSRLAPDGDPMFHHVAEGSDDMTAHIRTVITHSDLTIPVRDGRCDLGTWQGIYLWEHRTSPHRRSVVVTVLD